MGILEHPFKVLENRKKCKLQLQHMRANKYAHQNKEIQTASCLTFENIEGGGPWGWILLDLALQIMRGRLTVPDLIGFCFVDLAGAAHGAGSYKILILQILRGRLMVPDLADSL